MTITSFLKYYFPALAWGVIIFILLSLPEDNLPDLSFWQKIPYFDKLVHFGLFAIFSFLLCLAFKNQLCFNLLIKHWKVSSFLISTLYGGITEVSQKLFFTRSAELGDFLADICGSVLGVIIFNFIVKKYCRNGYKKIS